MLISGQHAGVVESLNFPNNYPPNSQCSWTIQASSGNTINYTFTSFQLEASDICNFDYIKVHRCMPLPYHTILTCIHTSTPYLFLLSHFQQSLEVSPALENHFYNINKQPRNQSKANNAFFLLLEQPMATVSKRQKRQSRHTNQKGQNGTFYFIYFTQ